MVDDWPRAILLQFLVDFPDELAALLRVGFHRLLSKLLFEFRITVTRVVAFRAATIILVELLVWVVDAAAGVVLADLVVLARHLGKPVGGLDGIERAVDIDVFELIDQDDRGIAKDRNVSRRDRQLQPVVRPVADRLHDPAGFGAVLAHVGIVTRHRLQQLRRHAPNPGRRRLHRPADIALPLGENVDKGFPV